MRPPRPTLKARRLMVAVAVLGIVPVLAKSVFIDNSPFDVLIATISALEGHATVYTEGYRESGFRSIRVGMTARQVEDLMGPPLEKGRWMDPGFAVPGRPITAGDGTLGDLWRYTRPGKRMGNYWRREVWFREGVVCHVDRSYYLD